MSFIDLLRSARSSRAAVLHEFWTVYDPAQNRLHAFFEGREDPIFYRPLIEAHTSLRLYAHRCDGKPQVYEVFRAITMRQPDCPRVLFFVDKDLSDILPEEWPTDPRIFVTECYSIENYLVSRESIARVCTDYIQLRGIKFDFTVVFDKFEAELERFHRRMIVVMAWVLLIRRGGRRPNLRNVQTQRLIAISPELSITRKDVQDRQKYLIQSTGIAGIGNIWRELRSASREIAMAPPKQHTRGKFEAWFLVEFVKKLVIQLRSLAAEVGASVTLNPAIEQSNLVAMLAGKTPAPPAIDAFLALHLGHG